MAKNVVKPAPISVLTVVPAFFNPNNRSTMSPHHKYFYKYELFNRLSFDLFVFNIDIVLIAK
jgi:hypothetical protein